MPESGSEREDAIASIVATGRTREQAEAFLAIARSAFARRGWIDGEPDSREELTGHVDRLIGGGPDASTCVRCSQPATYRVDQVSSRGRVILSEMLCVAHVEVEQRLTATGLSITTTAFTKLPS